MEEMDRDTWQTILPSVLYTNPPAPEEVQNGQAIDKTVVRSKNGKRAGISFERRQLQELGFTF
jgi:hypothetical protein